MTLFDFLIFILFGGALWYGYRKGVIMQLGAVGGIIVGFILCRVLGSTLTKAFAPKAATPSDLYVYGVFANLLLFAIGYVFMRLLANTIKSISTTLRLSIIDRTLGAIFTFLEWTLIASFLLNVIQAFNPKADLLGHARFAHKAPAKFVMHFAPTMLGAKTSDNIFGTVEKIGEAKEQLDEHREEIEEAVEFYNENKNDIERARELYRNNQREFDDDYRMYKNATPEERKAMESVIEKKIENERKQ